MTKSFPQPDKPEIQFIRAPPSPPAKLRIHFDGAIFYEAFSYRENTLIDVINFLVKSTKAYSLWVKSICRQKIVGDYAGDVIQSISKYLPPLVTNIPLSVCTRSKNLHNDLHTKLLDATRHHHFCNHSNIYFKQIDD